MNRSEKREDAYQQAREAHRKFLATCAELQHAIDSLVAELVLFIAERVAERVKKRLD